jgi:hypothetical protein
MTPVDLFPLQWLMSLCSPLQHVTHCLAVALLPCAGHTTFDAATNTAVLQLLVAVIRRQGRVSDAESLFFSLVSSMPHSAEVQSLVAACGHPKAVLSIMTAQATDLPTQQWGSDTLMALAYNGSHRTWMCEEGAVGVVVPAMLAFPHAEALQEAGSGVLWLIAFHRTCADACSADFPCHQNDSLMMCIPLWCSFDQRTIGQRCQQ